MNLITVEICTGTACHLFGSDELISIAKELPMSIQQHFLFKAVRCLGQCQNDEYAKAPFIKIGNTNYKNVKPDSFLTILKKYLEDVKGSTDD